MRRLTTLAILVALAAVTGCDPAGPQTIAPTNPSAPPTPAAPSPQPTPAGTPNPAPAATPAAGDNTVMATVNGKPIYMAALHAMLVRDHGMPLAQQLIAEELVNQVAAAKNIAATDADVLAENNSVLKKALGELPPEKDRERILATLIQQFGVTRPLWDMVMHRQAVLRKIAAQQVQVTEDQLKDEFAAQYGQKYIVRDIQCATILEAQNVRKDLEGIKDPVAIKKRFIELAVKNSRGVTAADGGLLPAITAKSTEVPNEIRDKAMLMRTAGELSQIIATGTAFHVLLLDGIEEPKNVQIADVRDKLTAIVKERQVAVLQQQILQDLIASAKKAGKIEFVNPTLKTQAAEIDKAAKESPK